VSYKVCCKNALVFYGSGVVGFSNFFETNDREIVEDLSSHLI